MRNHAEGPPVGKTRWMTRMPLPGDSVNHSLHVLADDHAEDIQRHQHPGIERQKPVITDIIWDFKR